MANPLYIPELQEMLASNDVEAIKIFLHTLHPLRTADFMENLEPKEIWAILQHAETPLKVEIFGFFDEAIQVDIIEQADRKSAALFIGDLPPDDRVDMLQDVEPDIVDELMPMVPVEERRNIQRLQSYEEETAGAEMTTDFARLHEDMSVGEALQEIIRQAEELETIYYLYVVDEHDHLRGLVSAKKLIASMTNPQRPLHEIMETDLVTVRIDEDQEEVARKVARYDLLAIPVVDEQHQMLGIITHDDVLDMMVEEMTEDAYLSAAVAPLSETYLETSIPIMSWKRGVWLTVLFFGSSLTALLLTQAETSLATVAWLMSFVPLVISTGGNSGNQSATLIITALSTHEITVGDWVRVVKREFATGILLGGFLAFCGYLLALVLGFLLKQPGITPFTALVIPITLVLVTLFGTLTGSLLPLLFRRLGLDPALMSNPLVACLCDVSGIFIYLVVAQLMLL